MPLVEYSSESEDDITPASKRHKITKQELPPLPPTFRDLYATPVRASVKDDPSLHEGRQRTIPHVKGDWPTHVYIEWNPCDSERFSIERLVRLACSETGQVHSLVESELGVPTPLHISLSRSLRLRVGDIDDFPDILRKFVKRSDVTAFQTQATGLKWYSNFNHSRWFLVLQLDHGPGDALSKLLNASNEVAKVFGQARLYSSNDEALKAPLAPGEVDLDDSHNDRLNDKPKSPPFHISIAWSLARPLSNETDQKHLDDPEIQKLVNELRIPIDVIKAKIGNIITSIPLMKTL